MNNEKVKEIKECLQSCNDDKMACYNCKYYEKCEKILTKNNILTLINELESDNESCHEVLADLKTIIKQQNDRIAELEKENETKTDTITALLKEQEFYEIEKLKQFAKKLKLVFEEYYNLSLAEGCIMLNDLLKEYGIGETNV